MANTTRPTDLMDHSPQTVARATQARTAIHPSRGPRHRPPPGHREGQDRLGTDARPSTVATPALLALVDRGMTPLRALRAATPRRRRLIDMPTRRLAPASR